ncbi:MAG: hypothetical protein KC944_19800 [Candidatus Omnitrophica bacterium]|nr:hypothetical protein [Candidatus Omnitrophota bacterium]MCA9444196.1 hypothetical protein [Candidatus Omnitrophota bacterium]
MCRFFFLLVICIPLCAKQAHSQWLERSYTIEEGWNAVFLDIEPYPEACEAQLGNRPINGVWARRDGGSTIEVVGPLPQLLSKGEEVWHVYYPPSAPETDISNLSILEAGRAYLIQASEEFTWTFTGRPINSDREWREGSLNLAGFYVDDSNPGLFSDFVSEDEDGNGPEVYQLLPDGGWTAVANLESATISPRTGYLVRGGFRYGAGAVLPLPDFGRQIDYPPQINLHSITLQSAAGYNGTVQLSLSSSAAAPSEPPSLGQEEAAPVAGDVSLLWRKSDDVTSTWQPLPASIPIEGDATPELEIDLAVNRLEMGDGEPTDLFQSILTISDGIGYRREFGVNGSPLNFSGLWSGSVVLNKVSQPLEPGTDAQIEDTPATIEFRLLIHVDDNDNVTLLDEVSQIWKPIEGDPDGGEWLLVTRSVPESLRTELVAGVISKQIPLPLHTSAINFELRDADNNPIDVGMSGTFFPGETLTATFSLYDQNPTNPFHHRYHPDHTWNENPLPSQIWDVKREITLSLSDGDASERAEVGWGDTWIDGKFDEVVTGIHEYAIQTQGTVRFQHTSRIGQLNGGQ